MPRYDIILLTEARYEQPAQIDEYVENVLREDQLVQEALETRGLKVARFDWSRKDVDWSDTRYALFRTTWDYFHRFAEFDAWMQAASTQTKFINPLSLIRWNIDKHYLRDLAEKGVSIVPTVYTEIGEKRGLANWYKEMGWEEAVLKPAISGAARHTYRLNRENVAAHEAIFQELIAHEAMMLQPFQQQIVKRGEVSFMVMGGQFTHAVLKVAKAGDFRVQDDFGGTVHLYEASEEDIAFAESVVRACDLMPAYARVDATWGEEGELLLVELELIEPEMWFRMEPQAAEVLADGIMKTYF